MILQLLLKEFQIETYVKSNIIIDHFPLHHYKKSQTMLLEWKNESFTTMWRQYYNTGKSQSRSLNSITSYFGAKVGFYISFLTTFAILLFFPAAFGAYVQAYRYYMYD
jgi:hypothetical protein